MRAPGHSQAAPSRRRPMREAIRVSAVIPASPERIYAAWLSGEEHSAFTEALATVEPSVGGRYTAHDGYIEGTNLELEPGRRIVQSWKSSQFPEGHAESRLEVLLIPVEGGTEVVLIHSEIPEGQGEDYAKGWVEHYFEPMARYFAPETGGEEELTDEPDPAVVLQEAAPAAVKRPRPKAKRPVAKRPVAKRPVAKRPVAKKPVAKKPAAKKPAAKKPAAKKPVAKKPVAKKPIAKKPAAKKPAAKKPA
ncbi:MAG: hypothetical protein EXR72_24515, partial [Myxococcales bacterium]|nr:hypothetical protein [Myxococcales bacterium]